MPCKHEGHGSFPAPTKLGVVAYWGEGANRRLCPAHVVYLVSFRCSRTLIRTKVRQTS